MASIKRGVDPEEFRQSAKHTLFVEGSGDEGIDPQVLTYLLQDITTIQIKPLGPSSHIRSAAEAFHKHHPFYYFLVDRDYHDNQIVEKYWMEFPHEDTCKLLIWRRRELENYFLIPEYLSKSSYLNSSPDNLKDIIRRNARARIFLDAANMVIVGCREEMKKNWIALFSSADVFDTKEKALEQLLKREDFAKKKLDVRKKLDKRSLTERFNNIVTDLFGNQDDLNFSYGSWLKMVSGKSILPTVINQCFRVKDVDGNALQGQKRLMEVVKGLLRLPLEDQPEDFRELHKMLSEQVKQSEN